VKKKFVGIQFIETVRDGKYTFAFGVYQDGKIGKVPFAGFSAKNPEDRENAETGRNFAIGRAAENLGKQIQKTQWKKFKRNGAVNSVPKLSAKEISALKNSPEAVAIREDRAAKRSKDVEKSAATSKYKNKESLKAGERGIAAASKKKQV
jgi:ketopantoate reductase